MIHSDSIPSDRIKGSRSHWGQIAFAVAALMMLILFRAHPSFRTFSITFVAIVLEALPFMLVGALAGGFIEVFVSQETLTRFLPNRRLAAIFITAGIGIVFP